MGVVTGALAGARICGRCMKPRTDPAHMDCLPPKQIHLLKKTARIEPETEEGLHFIGRYKDGCSVAPRCVKCPLPVCKFELPRGALHRQRNERIVELLQQGIPAVDVAADVGLSKRQVFRVVQEMRA